MAHLDRRDFLKIGAAAAAASAVPAMAENFLQSPAGHASVWTTSGDKRHSAEPEVRWSKKSPTGAVVTIDPTHQFQQVLGFGAAFTDAACFNISRLENSSRSALLHELFSPSEMNLSVSRICIGSSDYASKAYSYCEGLDPDPDLRRFSIEHDREYILPVLREARAANPDMWIFASPWSPPAWMKLNQSMLGGCMRRKWLGTYARYFEKFLTAYADAGVRVNSVSPQNEVDTDQDGRMPACAWPQEYEIEFVRDHLGPLLAASATPADIWILDHNYNLWGRVLCELEDERARKYITGVAWHGYFGSVDSMSRVTEAYPAVQSHWTEGGPDFDTPGYEIEWTKWADQFTGILRNSARSVIGWNYALDEKGKPNIGPFNCAGLVTIHSQTREIVRSGQYWALRHFAQHISRGARIVHSACTQKGVSQVVARNVSGNFVAVLTNSNRDKQPVSLVQGTSNLHLELAPDSVTTVTWS